MTNDSVYGYIMGRVWLHHAKSLPTPNHLLLALFRPSFGQGACSGESRPSYVRDRYLLVTCHQPSISPILLPHLPKDCQGVGKGLASPWSLLGLGKYLGTPGVGLGYTESTPWENVLKNRWWKNKFPYMAFSSYLCKSIRAYVWEQSEYNLGDGRETNK